MQFYLRQNGLIGLSKKHINPDPQVVRMVSKTSAMFVSVNGYRTLKMTGGLPDPLPPERHEALRLNTTEQVMFLTRNGNNIVKLI
jgi:hypothetical protein